LSPRRFIFATRHEFLKNRKRNPSLGWKSSFVKSTAQFYSPLLPVFFLLLFRYRPWIAVSFYQSLPFFILLAVPLWMIFRSV
jgi:hypothetical protein